jgi:hypothetical protein
LPKSGAPAPIPFFVFFAEAIASPLRPRDAHSGQILYLTPIYRQTAKAACDFSRQLT